MAESCESDVGEGSEGGVRVLDGFGRKLLAQRGSGKQLRHLPFLNDTPTDYSPVLVFFLSHSTVARWTAVVELLEGRERENPQLAPARAREKKRAGVRFVAYETRKGPFP